MMSTSSGFKEMRDTCFGLKGLGTRAVPFPNAVHEPLGIKGGNVGPPTGADDHPRAIRLTSTRVFPGVLLGIIDEDPPF